MELKDLQNACGFIVDGISYAHLCRCIAEIPGVVFTNKRRFFWGADDIRAEFTFSGHTFKIVPDPWDSALWVTPKDEQSNLSEIQDIRNHVSQYRIRPQGIIERLKGCFS